MTYQTLTGLLGGSFDPPHLGHYTLACDALEQLSLERVTMMPCYQHPFAKKLSPAQDRLEMLRLLTQDHPKLEVSAREIDRKGVSDTLTTLKAIAQDQPSQRIICLMGYDVLLNINQWEHWIKLFDYCHIGVFGRSGFNQQIIPGWLQQLIEAKTIINKEDLLQQTSGGIYFFENELPRISATQIRAIIAQKQRPSPSMIPADIVDYAIEHRIYHETSRDASA